VNIFPIIPSNAKEALSLENLQSFEVKSIY